jgi:hypothetical protein
MLAAIGFSNCDLGYLGRSRQNEVGVIDSILASIRHADDPSCLI